MQRIFIIVALTTIFGGAPITSFALNEKCGGYDNTDVQRCAADESCMIIDTKTKKWKKARTFVDEPGVCRPKTEEGQLAISIQPRPARPIWFGTEDNPAKKLLSWLTAAPAARLTTQLFIATNPAQDPCKPTPQIKKRPQTQKDCALPESCVDNKGVIECKDPEHKKSLDRCLEIDSSFL